MDRLDAAKKVILDDGRPAKEILATIFNPWLPRKIREAAHEIGSNPDVTEEEARKYVEKLQEDIDIAERNYKTSGDMTEMLLKLDEGVREIRMGCGMSTAMRCMIELQNIIVNRPKEYGYLSNVFNTLYQCVAMNNQVLLADLLQYEARRLFRLHNRNWADDASELTPVPNQAPDSV